MRTDQESTIGSIPKNSMEWVREPERKSPPPFSAINRYRYTFKQFRTVYQLVKSGQLSDNTYQAADVQKPDLSFYAEAFRARMARLEAGMKKQIVRSLDIDSIPIQRLTALLETFTLKHSARGLAGLLAGKGRGQRIILPGIPPDDSGNRSQRPE